MTRNYDFLGHYTYCVPGIGGMFGFLGWLLVGSLLGSVVIVPFRLLLDQQAAIEYGMLVSYPLQFIPAMMYASARSRNNCINTEGVRLDNNHFGKTGGFVCALLVALATLAAGFVIDPLTTVLPQMPEVLKQTLESMTQGTLWVNLLCVGVFAPIFEEWLCRGMVLRGLLGRDYKPVWAIVISAAFFALIHGNPWQAVPAFLIGCLMGYIYFKTGSLKLTMLMHCVNNSFAVILSHFDKFAEMETWLDVMPQKYYWMTFAACAMLLVLILRVFAAIPLESPRGNSDRVPSLFEQ